MNSQQKQRKIDLNHASQKQKKRGGRDFDGKLLLLSRGGCVCVCLLSWGDLHVLRVVAQAVQEARRFDLSGADLVDRRKQGEPERGVVLVVCVEELVASPTNLSSIDLLFSIKLTSSAVIGPCNFCPLSISSSSCLMDLPVLTNASDTLRLRPPAINRNISHVHHPIQQQHSSP